jgi:tRNA modification GTPase
VSVVEPPHDRFGGARWCITSATKGEGLAELRRAIVEALRTSEKGMGGGNLELNLRQKEALRASLGATARALATARKGLGIECVASDLKEAMDHLGVLSGRVITEDILDLIFSQFCIGK